MATYRKTAPALTNAPAPAFLYHDFPSYNEALTFSRANGLHKPLRMDMGARWRVAQLNPQALGKAPAPAFVKLPAWVPPFRGYCCTKGPALASLPAL